MHDRVLIIKGNYNSFEKYYLNHMNSENCDTFEYYDDRTKLSNIRRIWIHFGLPLEHIWYSAWKRVLNNCNLIILFDSICNPKIVSYINNHRSANSRLILWHWNNLNSEKNNKIYKKTKDLCEQWTFDPYDAKKYKMKLNNQFFFKQKIKNNNIKWDVYFIGSDKGRYDILKNLYDEFRHMEISANISILKDKTSYQSGDLYIDKLLPYNIVLKNIESSNCVIEICQEGQSGITTRALEAMFFNKKLITNNKSIVKQKFYDEKNIMLIKNGSHEQIKNFLKTPFHQIDKEKLFPYTFEGWINNFK
jgi:hypothetical protein